MSRLDTFDVSSPCIFAVSSLSNSTTRHTRLARQAARLYFIPRLSLLPKQLPPSSYTSSSTLVLSLLWSSEMSNKLPPTHPEWACSNYMLSCSKIPSRRLSLLFCNLFIGLKFLNELNIKSSLSLTKLGLLIPLSHYLMTSYLFSPSRSQHTLFTLCYSDQAYQCRSSIDHFLHHS